jgi:Flp pilus assembly protein TadD
VAASATLASAQRLIRKGRRAEAISLLEQNHILPECAARLRELYLGEHDNERAAPLARQLAVGRDAEACVSRSVLALMARDLDSAVRECEQALVLDPDCASAFNHLGRALHNADQALQANSALRKATALQPDYPEAWYNLGLVLRASGALAEAIKAYRQALDLAPGYRAAELNLGISQLLAEQYEEALYCLQSVLERYPDDTETLVNSGLALHTLGRFALAREHLQKAIDNDPGNPVAWTYLGLLLHEIHAPEEALEALQQAVALDPMDVEAWVEIASIHEQANRLAQSRQALESGRNVQPRHPALLLELARLQRREGEETQALDTLRSLHSGGLPVRLAQQYQFELGNLLDRNGAHDAALEAYAEGKRLMARSVRRRDIDPQGFERRCHALENWLLAGAPGSDERADDPQQDRGADLCFLVGFPRSGTTLLDTMLDAHSAVASIEEQPTLEVVIDELAALPGGYPGALAQVDGHKLAQLRSMYREQCRQFLGEARPGLVVDKLPLRLLHAGLIRRLFPDARLLFSLRHPCDVVLSNFMQAYAENEAFVHFDTLASSVAMYERVMGLWQSLQDELELTVAYTRYEDLVADPQAEMARVCAYMGLEPEPAMFDAAQRMAQRAPVRTTSYQQVAEPVYLRSAGRWKNYATHLEPFIERLSPFIERFGYSAQATPR